MTVTCHTEFKAKNRVSKQGSISGMFTEWFDAVVSRAGQYMERRAQYKIDRDAFRTLERLDERELNDIGLTKDDVIWASRLPLSVNASKELAKVANGRKR